MNALPLTPDCLGLNQRSHFCVILGRSFNFSEPKPVYLFDNDNNNDDDNSLPHGDFVKVKCVNDCS